MLNYQKKAYLNIWGSIIGILTIPGLFLAIHFHREAITVILYFIIPIGLSCIIGIFIGMFLLQIIGGRIVDYRMSKVLNQTDFQYYMDRRQQTREDIAFENCIGQSINITMKNQYIRPLLEDNLKNHKLLYWYAKTFLFENFEISL